MSNVTDDAEQLKEQAREGAEMPRLDSHDPDEGLDMRDVQERGMAWNVTDFERHGMGDFDREYDKDDDIEGGPQEYRTAGHDYADETMTAVHEAEMANRTDEELTADLMAQLANDGRLNVGLLKATVSEGKAVVGGTVPDAAAYAIMEAAVGRVGGITELVLQVEVVPEANGAEGDQA